MKIINEFKNINYFCFSKDCSLTTSLIVKDNIKQTLILWTGENLLASQESV